MLTTDGIDGKTEHSIMAVCLSGNLALEDLVLA
jgi:hypothetical protein